MSIEADLNKHLSQEAQFNCAYEYHFKQVLEEPTFLEQVMMEHFPEKYEEVISLPVFHQQMMNWYASGTVSKIKDKWIEEVQEEALTRAEG
jgi:hypothetical protein